MNKRLLISESCSNSNRCTPYRGNLINTPLPLSRKSAPDSTSQPAWVAHETHLSFSPNTTIEAVGLSQAFIDGMLLGLLGSYLQHAIDMFNTYSWGSTHRCLTDTGGGYKLEGVSLPHHTPPPLLNQWSSAFHLRVPPDLRLTIHPSSWTKEWSRT
jgi:hypothetical protein